jgi:hypothetical protein
MVTVVLETAQSQAAAVEGVYCHAWFANQMLHPSCGLKVTLSSW